MTMKADETAMTRSKRGELHSKPKSFLGRRNNGRVPVKLRVAIATKNCSYLAESADISETGMLVQNYYGPRLSKGKKVFAIVRGVISDADDDGGISTWYVARVDSRTMALTFSPELAA